MLSSRAEPEVEILLVDLAESAFRFFDDELEELPEEVLVDVRLFAVDDEEPPLLVLRLVAALEDTPPVPGAIVPGMLLADDPAPDKFSLSEFELLPNPPVESFTVELEDVLTDRRSDPKPELLLLRLLTDCNFPAALPAPVPFVLRVWA